MSFLHVNQTWFIKARRQWKIFQSPYWLSTGIIGLSLVAALLMFFSTRWPIVNDLPVNLYDGFLMHAFGSVPYRDFYDINAPGTHFVFYLIHVLSGGSDAAVRFVDLFLLLTLNLFTFLFLRPYGTRAALASPLMFSIMYLEMGPEQALQREYLTLLPLILSLVLAFRLPKRPIPLRSFLIGVLFGVIASIKPLLFPFLPVLLVFMAATTHTQVERASRLVLSSFFWAGIGSALVFAAIGFYFFMHGAAADLVEMVTQYWPLYNRLDENAYTYGHIPITAWSRWIKTFPFVLAIPFFPVFVLTAVLVPFRNQTRQRRIELVVLGSLALWFFAYIPLSFKFWLYHWIPLYYSIALFAGMAYGEVIEAASRIRLAVWVTGLTLLSVPFGRLQEEYTHWKQGTSFTVRNGDVDIIQRFLEARLRPSDRVLPLDMGSGALHGMYRAKARLAGKFPCDYYFYHHTDRPIIQKLRRQMMQSLASEPPRFVIRFKESWRPIGPFSNRFFPELDHFLNTQYDVVLDSERFNIMQIRSFLKKSQPY